MNIVECTHLEKVYGNKKALDNLSIAIQENKITGLIGRNGAGKTTLLNILAGYTRESSGHVNVFNQHPFNHLFESTNTILVDNQKQFSSTLTLDEILEVAGRFYKNWDMNLARRLVHYFNFNEKEIHENLSKGKKST